MTQRVKHCPNSLNLETVACEKYITRLLQKEKIGALTGKLSTMPTNPPRKVVKQSTLSSSTVVNHNQLIRAKPNVKQQNIPSSKSIQLSPPDNTSQYGEEAALVEVTVKTTNPRPRSRSTAADREPWGQLLKQHKSSEKISVFSNFDPLRTLHFLAKELQHHIQSIAPDDGNVQQMVNDMQYALKRVPPEVASIIHLQQAIDLLPAKKSSRSLDDNDSPEKFRSQSKITSDQIIQTDPYYEDEDARKLQKVMEESTMKLEISCRQMESLCEQLKNEKQSVEKQLAQEQDNVVFLKKRIDDLEFECNDILHPKVKILMEEKKKVETEANNLIMKMETESAASLTELQTVVTGLKSSKAEVETECARLKHQLRLSSIEKEKYIAVLAVRDRQIDEIRTEMTQLQEVVNEQLMELHNNAFASMPSNTNVAINSGTPWNIEENKEHMGDVGDPTLSSIHTNDDVLQKFFVNKPNIALFRDIPCGDTLRDIPSENLYRRRDGHSSKDHKTHHVLERPDSQASIRCMFNDLKKTAYELTGTQNHS